MVHSWKRRWIVLTKQKLSYYTDESMSDFRGKVLLTPESSVVNEDGRVHRLKFMITQNGRRARVFQASNEESRSIWVRTITAVLEQLQQDVFMGADSVWEDIGEGEERDSGSAQGKEPAVSVEGSTVDKRFSISGVWRRVGKSGNALTGGDGRHPLDPRDNIVIRKHYSYPSSAIDKAMSATDSSVVTGAGGGSGSRSASLVTSYSIGLIAAGWLRKKGHINFNWKVRWFELSLTSSSEGRFAYYINRSPDDSGWTSRRSTRGDSSEHDSSEHSTATAEQQHQTSYAVVPTPRESRFSMRRNETQSLGSFCITKDTRILNRSSGPGTHKFALFNANGPWASTEPPALQRLSARLGGQAVDTFSDERPPKRERLGFIGRVKSEVLFLAAVSEVRSIMLHARFLSIDL